MIELLITLAAIATSVMLDKSLTYIATLKNEKRDISPDDIIAAVSKMTTEARAKGNEVLTKLNDKLGSINMPFGVSSSVKDYITKTKNDLSKEITNTRKDISDVETKLTQAENRANNLAYQSEDYRNRFGKEHLDDIIKGAKAGFDKVTEIEQKLGGQNA